MAWPLCCLWHLLCGLAPVLFTLFTALAAVRPDPYPYYIACGVASPLSFLALMLFTALAVRLGSYAVYRTCCVACFFGCLQRLLCDLLNFKIEISSCYCPQIAPVAQQLETMPQYAARECAHGGRAASARGAVLSTWVCAVSYFCGDCRRKKLWRGSAAQRRWLAGACLLNF